MTSRDVPSADWFARSFDEHYARIYEYKDGTAQAEVGQILRYLHLRRIRGRPTPRILDLACGWGRHSIPLALRGFDVTGVDFSDVMLDRAEQRANSEGLTVRRTSRHAPGGPRREHGHEGGPEKRLTLLQADMRDLPFQREFEIVIDIFTSFGYFRDPGDNEAVLAAVYEALVPGGRFLLDIDNPQVFIDKRTGENTFSVADNGGQERVLRVEKYTRERDRRVVEYSFIDRPSDSREDIYLECKLYDRAEMIELLTRSGFKVGRKVWGDFAGTTFSPSTSPRLIILATKPKS